MGKEIATVIRPDDGMFDEAGAAVIRFVEQIPQGLQVELLADHRRDLGGPLVLGRQAIEASQNETLNRGRYLLIRALLGIVQQLLEEQRIAFRTFDTLHCHALVGIDEAAGQCQCIHFPQGSAS